MVKIIGIKLPQRLETAPAFQEILSKYGCSIRTRLGIHDVNEGHCSPDGVILLDLVADDEIIKSMVKDLKNIAGLKCEMLTL